MTAINITVAAPPPTTVKKITTCLWYIISNSLKLLFLYLVLKLSVRTSFLVLDHADVYVTENRPWPSASRTLNVLANGGIHLPRIRVTRLGKMSEQDP